MPFNKQIIDEKLINLIYYSIKLIIVIEIVDYMEYMGVREVVDGSSTARLS